MTTSLENAPMKRSHLPWAKLHNYLSMTWPLYVMLLPALTALAIFHYYPMYGVVIAFQDFNPGLGFARSPWVGLYNFEYLLTGPDFKIILRNSFVIAVSKLLSLQLCAVILALMLGEIRGLLFKRTLQTVVYLPHFLSWVVLSGIVLDLLSSLGVVNKALGLLGIGPIQFLGSNKWFVPTLILTNVWKSAGWATIIYLAALTGLDPMLYEAAAIDGAGRWKRMLHVTLPGIRPTVVLVACLNLGSVLEAGFGQILNLYNPTVYRTGDILDTYVYRVGLISAQYGLGGAIGLFKSLMGFLLIVIAYWLADRYAGYRIF